MNSVFLPVRCLALIFLVTFACAAPLLDPKVFKDCLKLQTNHGITVKRCRIDAIDGGYYVVKAARDSSEKKSMTLIENELHAINKLQETLQKNGINPQDIAVVYPLEFKAPKGVITFPYYPNGDLQQYYSMHDLKIDHDIALIARDVLRTLTVLHNNRINFAHNDIKMENIVITSVGDDGRIQEVKLIDLEQVGVHQDINDGYYGTTDNFSPEIVSGATHVKRYQDIALVSKSSDIWALGATLCALIFEEKPFLVSDADLSSRSRRAIWKHRRQYFNTWRKIRFSLKLSATAKDFLLKLLKWDLKERLTASEALNHPFIQEFEARKTA